MDQVWGVLMSVKRSNPDQYQLRFPPGLRDRIKAAAELNGRSMNAEIIRVLEREFPEPFALGVHLDHLKHLMTALVKVRGHAPAFDALTREMMDIAEAISSGRVADIDEETREHVARSLKDWKEMRHAANESRLKWQEGFDGNEL
jgi:hypothetical protein